MTRSIIALLKDRRRRQRGSVLSAVLIMVAFLAILSGALLTALSDNFLLAHALVDRTINEATVDSAMELALSQLQDTRSTPLFNGCPGVGPLALNGLTAGESYASCYPVIDAGSSQTLSPVVTGGQSVQAGMHASVPGAGVDAYLAGDSSGNLFAVPTGTAAMAWSYALGGELTGPPLAMADPSTPGWGVSYVVPVGTPSGWQAAGCANGCVALLSASRTASPTLTCLMPANALVTAEPAAGLNFSFDTFFGDTSGTLWAYSAIAANQTPACDIEATADITQNIPGAAVVAGPFVVRGTTGKKVTDEIYAVVTAGSQSYLVHYTYALGKRSQPAFSYDSSLALVGVATGASLEAPTSRIAIGFANGRIALAQVQSNFTMTLLASASLGSVSVTGAPFWSASGQIGVAAGSTLYVVDSGLNVLSSFTAPGTITGTPAADLGGDWFVGAGGSIYEAQAVGGSPQMAQRAVYGGAGNLTSAPVGLACSAGSIGICIYAGAGNGNVYFAGLDARHAMLDSCLSACGSTNFSLRAEVEVGDATSPRTVHVLGWSYYSP